MEGGGNCGGTNYRMVGGYVGPLPPATALMVPGQEDVEHGPGREGGEVSKGLHSGDGSTSLLELVCLRPQT